METINDVGGVQLKIRLRFLEATNEINAINDARIYLNKCLSLCTYDNRSLSIPPSVTLHYGNLVAEEVEVILKANRNYSCAQVFLKDLLRLVYRSGSERRHAQPLLQVTHPPEAFFQACTPAHMGCCLLAFELGNFIHQSIFYEHYDKRISMCELRSLSRLRGQPQRAGLIVDFEHDRNSFTIRFATKTFNKGLQEYTVALVVNYEWIRCIIVDPECTDSEGEEASRIYLQLSCLPRVFRDYGRGNFVSNGKRYVDWHDTVANRRYDSRPSQNALKECNTLSLVLPENETDLHEIVGRLKARTQLPIYFDSVKNIPVALNNYLELEDNSHICQQWSQRCSFAVKYAIEALLSRGAVVKDQLLLDTDERDTFLALVYQKSLENELLTVEALERLLNSIDERRNVTLIDAFEKLFEQLKLDEERLREMRRNDLQDGYIRVRKVIVTPSRQLFFSPERMMGNRVVNKFDPNGEFFLRIQFRDDDGSVLRAPVLIDRIIYRVMKEGLTIAGRHFAYLGSSNSQLRDHGCYFFAQYSCVTVNLIRQWMGEFDMENIAKRMARMGQCLTQARKLINLAELHYKTDQDVQRRGEGNKLYTFSDGVGRISLAYATDIAEGFRLKNHVPSCFQFRFRGFKGVLSVDPTLDERILRSKGKGHHIIFRESQRKFQTPAAHYNGRTESLEIVKFSAPATVCLNRPMISILDQISAKQGAAVHTRITERIHHLLESNLHELAGMLIDEAKCAKTLAKELPHRFNVRRLKDSGFALTTEPFMRSLTRAIARYKLKRQLIKDQIQIPSDLGRTLFGVMDETGQLNYGEVFIQITEDVNATPGFYAKKRIISGRVMVTKNPCTVLSDIRLLEAVDVPQLRHLNDVIVFPSRGPRPHPDEMAGSDLDGDEYAAIWDHELMFNVNEPVGPREPLYMEKRAIDEQNLDAEMIEFFLKFIKSGSIGAMSNAHLVKADKYGIESDVCKTIAEKCFQAVDFAKTGAMPADLTNRWEDDLPPERPVYYPDFMGYDFKPTYFSPRLPGQIFRRIKAIDNVYDLTEKAMEAEVVIDTDLVLEGCNNRPLLLMSALQQRNQYAALIRALMEEYGIVDEGQLMSGNLSSLRNRLSDREHEDYSAYTTDRIIKKRVTEIVDQFRAEFFAEFGGVELCTVPVDEWNEGRRVCTNPSPEMLLKASAWYLTTYLEDSTGLLGFPWVVWDVLAFIKQSKRRPNASCDPIAQSLSARINDFGSNAKEELTKHLALLQHNQRLASCVQKYIGLDKLFLTLMQWLFTGNTFPRAVSWTHTCMLFVDFGLGNKQWSFPRQHDNFLSLAGSHDQLAAIDLNANNDGKLGRCLIDFLQYLASRDFSITATADILPLHRLAIRTFYQLALTGKFDALGLSRSNSTIHSGCQTIVEVQPFTIEMPRHETYPDDYVRQRILEKTGVDEVHLRRMERNEQVMISARGTFESLHRLRELVIVDHTKLRYLVDIIVAQ